MCMLLVGILIWGIHVNIYVFNDIKNKNTRGLIPLVSIWPNILLHVIK